MACSRNLLRFPADSPVHLLPELILKVLDSLSVTERAVLALSGKYFATLAVEHKSLEYGEGELDGCREGFFHRLISHWVFGETRWCRDRNKFQSVELPWWVDCERRVREYIGQPAKGGSAQNKSSELDEESWYGTVVNDVDSIILSVDEWCCEFPRMGFAYCPACSVGHSSGSDDAGAAQALAEKLGPALSLSIEEAEERYQSCKSNDQLRSTDAVDWKEHAERVNAMWPLYPGFSILLRGQCDRDAAGLGNKLRQGMLQCTTGEESNKRCTLCRIDEAFGDSKLGRTHCHAWWVPEDGTAAQHCWDVF